MSTGGRKIHIIGTAHTLQKRAVGAGSPSAAEAALAKVICQSALACGAKLVAEEMSIEGLGDGASSIAQEAATSIGVPHLFCDPTYAERTDLALLERSADCGDARRESEWLQRIAGRDAFPLLMICGANHVDPFTRMCSEAGYEVIVIEPDWAPQIPTPLERRFI
jgi:hypothetical protein